MSLGNLFLLGRITWQQTAERAWSGDDQKQQLYLLTVLILIKLSRFKPRLTSNAFFLTGLVLRLFGAGPPSLQSISVQQRLKSQRSQEPVRRLLANTCASVESFPQVEDSSKNLAECLSVPWVRPISVVLVFLLTLLPWGCVQDTGGVSWGHLAGTHAGFIEAAQVKRAKMQFLDFSSQAQFAEVPSWQSFFSAQAIWYLFHSKGCFYLKMLLPRNAMTSFLICLFY